MTCEECETLCIFLKEHLAEVTVTETNLTLISNRTGDTESLEAFADCSSSVSSSCAALLYSDSAAYCVSPLCIFKTDRLDALNELIDIQTLCLTYVSALLDGADAVVLENVEDLLLTSLI